ncbi:MAG: PHP domain-containing protein [Dehalococcoidia bacterium]|nr:PHP domain-containing protein [Chloroflexota bacterium]
MILADLHTHTNFSDGELSPSEILNEALVKKIKYLSITDHDTLTGYKKAKKIVSSSYYNQITLIPGVEISTSFEGSYIHTLGYFFDDNNKELNETLKLLQIRRNEFAKNVLNFLNQKGFEISWGDILTNVNGSLGRLHIAYAMKNKGIVKKVSDAFDKYLNPFKENYEKEFEFNTIDIIKLINSAGGVCSIAHPHTVNNAENLIQKLVKNGLTGIEIVKNKEIFKTDEEYLNLGLVKTAGSDFHKNGKNSYLGKNNFSEEEFINFYEKSKNTLNGKIKWNL